MKMRSRSAFSLVELLVVIAILAVLTALVLPKLEGLLSKANHGVGAASADDLGRNIQIYRTTKNLYPDGYDSLLDAAGTGMWMPAAGATTPGGRMGVHSSLTGGGDATTAKLTVTALTGKQAASLARVGITTIYNLGTYADTATTPFPGDRYVSPVVIHGPVADDSSTTADESAPGQNVCIVNSASSGGKKIIDHIYRANLRTGGTSGALPANKVLVVLGFGPQNAMVGNQMLEVPFYPNTDPTMVYNRNLVIFEVDGNGGRADFKAVVGTDGDLLSDMAADFFK